MSVTMSTGALLSHKAASRSGSSAPPRHFARRSPMLHISSGRLAAVAPNQRVWRIDSACRRQRLFRVVMAAGPSTDEATETDKGIDSSAPPQSRISSKRDMAFSVKDEVLGPTGKMPPDSEVVTLATILANSSKPAESRKAGLITAADQQKEDSRRYRRTIFGFDQWREHRSTARYARHITGVAKSGIVRGLAGPLWAVAGIAVLVGGYETLREAGQLPPGWGSLSLKGQAYSYSSFALSLLLVFRTNSSYGRWDEARKMWGLMVNRSRDFTRQATTWFPEQEPELMDLVMRWTIALSASLKVHLREDGDVEEELEGVLMPGELKALKASAHRPNFVLSVLSSAVEQARMPNAARVRCDVNLTNFADVVGGSERILKTPIPLSYTRHTSRFLIVFITFLPFTLWSSCGWATLPVSVAIAFLLLGIEEIGVQVEEPFAILPLEGICATIATNCREMHSRRHEVRRQIYTACRPIAGTATGKGRLAGASGGSGKHEER